MNVTNCDRGARVPEGTPMPDRPPTVWQFVARAADPETLRAVIAGVIASKMPTSPAGDVVAAANAIIDHFHWFHD